MEIGVQFFTLREFCKDLQGLSESLKKVADIGYKNVQLSGTCDFEGEWMAEELKKSGLRCVVTHTPREQLLGDLNKVVANHNAFNCENIGLGYYKFGREDDSDYKEFFETYKPVAEGIKARGSVFNYHCHNSEFKRLSDGKLVIEHIMEDFPADELRLIPDTFWIQAGGADPAACLKKLAGRIPNIHLKDYRFRPWMETKFSNYFAPIGEGNINFERVFAAAEEAGTEYMLVEQDNCYGEDPFECLKRSYDYLTAQGFH